MFWEGCRETGENSEMRNKDDKGVGIQAMQGKVERTRKKEMKTAIRFPHQVLERLP